MEQAENAIAQLEKDELQRANKRVDIISWTEETHRKAHLLALYEVYRQLPYLSIKNDLIGIASATTLIVKAVQEHTSTTDKMKEDNGNLEKDLKLLSTLLLDYNTIGRLLETELDKKSQEVAQQELILDSEPLEKKVSSLFNSVFQQCEAAKRAEELLYAHLQRLVVKLHAMIDWENTSVADEETFRNNIVRSTTFLKTLVTSLVSSVDLWVPVDRGTPEDRLAKLMIHHDILRLRPGRAYEVALRNYL